MTTTQDVRMDRKQAAEYLGVSEAFMAADVVTNRHKIPHFKIGRLLHLFEIAARYVDGRPRRQLPRRSRLKKRNPRGAHHFAGGFRRSMWIILSANPHPT